VQYGITGFKLSPEAAGFDAGAVPLGWSGELTVDAFPDLGQNDMGFKLGNYKGNETVFINDPQVLYGAFGNPMGV
jgi:hypothetical protein